MPATAKPSLSSDTLPSQSSSAFWLYQSGPLKDSKTGPSGRIGKWMVFLSTARADELWPKIKANLKSGELASAAIAAKISVPKPDKPNSHVLIIYTSDFTDKVTVRKCLAAIRALGITGEIYYKTDQQTFSGLYAGGKQRPWTYSSDMFENAK